MNRTWNTSKTREVILKTAVVVQAMSNSTFSSMEIKFLLTLFLITTIVYYSMSREFYADQLHCWLLLLVTLQSYLLMTSAYISLLSQRNENNIVLLRVPSLKIIFLRFQQWIIPTSVKRIIVINWIGLLQLISELWIF